MDLNDLRTLLDYHYWARDRILAAVVALTPEQFTKVLGRSFRSIRDTLVHIYSAEHVWYSRWLGVSLTAHVPPGDFPDVGTLRAAWEAQEVRVRAFVEQQGSAGIDSPFDYKLFSGVAASSRFGDMVQHVVNHATYHRGQVTTMLRQLGAKPATSMDFIAYRREKGGPRL
jgi:uncharacterized damage-inducible protein DinB